jgi:P-type E1-E2 ATPase
VICCRVSPKQKADVVGLAKKSGKWITLSIGDGANDVPMIMEAHIGVGIRGKEGSQAVRSADYAIGQFKFLQKLILAHGRWGYRRVGIFVCYYFYKNVLLVFCELYFAFYNGFSGQIYFADWLPMLYNAFWTSWPCIFTFVFERDVDSEYSLNYP